MKYFTVGHLAWDSASEVRLLTLREDFFGHFGGGQDRACAALIGARSDVTAAVIVVVLLTSR